MQSRGWILSTLAVVLVAAAATFVAVRDPGDPSAEITSANRSSTTQLPTTSSPTTTSSSTTTMLVSTTTIAAPATTRPPTEVTTSPPTAAPSPPFEASIETVTAAQLGASWRPDFGCPAPEQLRAVNVSHWGYDGAVHEGRIIVDAAHADSVVSVFRDIYAARFPIQQMIPIDAYGGDDQASMRANNTSGFNCRYVAGTTTLSQHGLGRAIDVNPLVNPYVKGGSVDPPEGAPYADRRRTDQGMIHARDAVVSAFARHGWSWGGYWQSGQDYQHFSAGGG